MGCLICIKLNPVFQMEFNGSLKHQAVDIDIKEELIEEKDKTCNESIGKFLKMTITMTLSSPCHFTRCLVQNNIFKIMITVGLHAT